MSLLCQFLHRERTAEILLYPAVGFVNFIRLDTPLSGTVLTFSQQQDFLALSVEFTPHDAVTAVIGLDNDLTGEGLDEEAMSSADEAVIQSVYRLFSAMNRTVRSEFLRKNIMLEDIACRRIRRNIINDFPILDIEYCPAM